MDTDRIIIHRANAIVNEYPIEAVMPAIKRGYRNLEIDITVTGQLSFKFCHTSQLQVAPITFRFDSAVFTRLAELDVSLWLVDMKYPFGDPPPVDLLKNIYGALGRRVVFAAAQPELLEAAHELGARTTQFFRTHISPDLSFEPDFYLYGERRNFRMPLDKTMMYCRTYALAEEYLAKGVPYVMVELETMESGV